MLESNRNFTGPVYGSLRTYKSGKSCQEIIKAAKKGREKALLSISRYCVRLSDQKRDIHEFWSDRPPSLGDLVNSLGPDYQLVAISRERKPMRQEIKAIPYFGSVDGADC